MNGKLLVGQKEKPLNNTLYIQQINVQLRKRGLHPDIMDSQRYNEMLNSGRTYNMNVEKQIEQAKQDAKAETRRLQDLFPSFEVDTERYAQEFREHARSLE